MSYPGLDPSLEKTVADLAAVLDRKPHEREPAEFRAMMAERAAALPLKRPAGLTVEELTFETPFGSVPARLYRPDAVAPSIESSSIGFRVASLVPEPGTALFLVACTLGFAGWRRRLH